ncbi:MAG TPA: alcohol dehydrogenase catalytic domain-containing protein [Ktedonobacteraceae bacterium]
MRALVFRNNVLTLEKNYPLPGLQSGEALIRVLLAGICNTDLEITRGYLAFQGVLGHEFVGIVEAVHEGPGASPPTYLVGKRVVGDINAACHRSDCPHCRQNMFTHCPNRTTLGIVNRDGAFAEYLTLPVANLHLVPESISDEEAVFVEPLAANFEILEQVHIKPTDRVVVLGDGKMGQLAAQVLALSGCEVTMIGKHAEKLAIAMQRGIQTRLLDDVVGAQFIAPSSRVDLVVECSGSTQGLDLAMRLVRPRGTIILKSTVADKSALHLAPIVIDEIRIQGSRCGPFAPAIRALSQKLVDVRLLISADYTLDEGLAAFQYAAQNGVLKVLVKV